MTAKSDRQAAREAVAAFHEAQLAGLVEHIGSAVDRFRSGQMDAFDVDQVLFQYARAAKELWKFLQSGRSGTRRWTRPRPPTPSIGGK